MVIADQEESVSVFRFNAKIKEPQMLDFRLTPTGSCILCKPLFHLPLAAPILIILLALAKKLDVFMKMDFTERPQGAKI